MKTRSFEGKVAAVTGAASGIGRALAAALAQRGCHLALCDLDEAGLAATASSLSGIKVSTRRVDVSDGEAVRAWARAVVEEHGRVNLVFNNAGISYGATVGGADEADFRRVIDVDYWGVVHGTRAFLPHLEASGDGHVVNTSSLFGLIAFPGQSAYNSAKFAVRGFTEALQIELEMTRLPVVATCVHPGGVKTNIARSSRLHHSLSALGMEMSRAQGDFEDEAFRLTAPEAAEIILRGVSRNRRRVLVGGDARLMDFLQRLFPGSYQAWWRASSGGATSSGGAAAVGDGVDHRPEALEDLDVLIVGAGLSGIDAAYRLKTECPDKRFAILEARDAIGGTWDLFRYPGIRSDSDIFTLGFPFHPWTGDRAIASGASIRQYLHDTAARFGIHPHIRFRRRAVAARWSSEDARWTVEVDSGDSGEQRPPERLRCRFLFLCTGYYRYDAAHAPELPGASLFRGRVVHPQWWPEDLDYSGRRVVVIGSGATAVTLIPAMSAKAAHVTMVQRSPSYIAALPDRDIVADALRAILPSLLAHRLIRSKNILLGLVFYAFCRRFPKAAARLLRRAAAKRLPPGYPVDLHFQPRYDPWDQRLCLAPNGDFFDAIAAGKVSVVTDTIERYTEKGLRLSSGGELEADLIITATGLKLLPMGGICVEVDGRALRPGDLVIYRGAMFSGVPNVAWCMGYSNAAWTLRSDLSARYVCRLLKHMDRHGHDIATPTTAGTGVERRAVLDLTSGYVSRSLEEMPKSGARSPWVVRQNYLLDFLGMVLGRVDEPSMSFSRRGAPPASAPGGESPSPSVLAPGA